MEEGDAERSPGRDRHRLEEIVLGVEALLAGGHVEVAHRLEDPVLDPMKGLHDLFELQAIRLRGGGGAAVVAAVVVGAPGAEAGRALLQVVIGDFGVTGIWFMRADGIGEHHRVFAVFGASNPDYGLTRVMAEAEYYPEPYAANTVGWQRSSSVLP